jgi:hypothetical protein
VCNSVSLYVGYELDEMALSGYLSGSGPSSPVATVQAELDRIHGIPVATRSHLGGSMHNGPRNGKGFAEKTVAESQRATDVFATSPERIIPPPPAPTSQNVIDPICFMAQRGGDGGVSDSVGLKVQSFAQPSTHAHAGDRAGLPAVQTDVHAQESEPAFSKPPETSKVAEEVYTTVGQAAYLSDLVHHFLTMFAVLGDAMVAVSHELKKMVRITGQHMYSQRLAPYACDFCDLMLLAVLCLNIRQMLH